MPTGGVPRIDSGFEDLEPRTEAEVLPPYEPAVPIRTLGRFTAEERGVEAQHKRYFGDKGHWKSRFKLLLDPNGLETCESTLLPRSATSLTMTYTVDSLELVLDGNRSARIGAVWSKQQVFETVGSIYKRIDSFLETIRHQGYTQPFAKWEVTFQKKSRKDIESSGELESHVFAPSPDLTLDVSSRVVGLPPSSMLGGMASSPGRNES